MTQEAEPMGAKGKPSALISYSSKDRKTAERLEKALQQNGIDVWRDQTKLKIGDVLSDKIPQAISEADFVIVLISKYSVRSDWVAKELSLAFTREIIGAAKILPVLLDDSEIPPKIADKVFADLQDEANFDDVVNSLHKAMVDQRGGPLSAAKPDSLVLDPTLRTDLLSAIDSSDPTVLEETARKLRGLVDTLRGRHDPRTGDAETVLEEFLDLSSLFRVWRRRRRVQIGLAVIAASIVFFVLSVSVVRKYTLPPELQLAQDQIDQGELVSANNRLDEVAQKARWWLLADIRVKALRLQGDCARQLEDPTGALDRYNEAWRILEEPAGLNAAKDEELEERANDVFDRVRRKKARQEIAHIVRGRAALRSRTRFGSDATMALLNLAYSFFDRLGDQNGQARVRIIQSEELLRRSDCGKALETMKLNYIGTLSPMVRAKVYWQNSRIRREPGCEDPPDALKFVNKALRCAMNEDKSTDVAERSDEELIDLVTTDSRNISSFTRELAAELLYWGALDGDGTSCEKLSEVEYDVNRTDPVGRPEVMFAIAIAFCWQEENEDEKARQVLQQAFDLLPRSEGEVMAHVLDMEIDLRLELMVCYMNTALGETDRLSCDEALDSIGMADDTRKKIRRAMTKAVQGDKRLEAHRRYKDLESYEAHLRSRRNGWTLFCGKGS